MMNEKPGSMKIIKKEKIADINISTHSMSLSFLIKYLEKELSLNIILVGFQPAQLDFNTKLSQKIKNNADNFISTISSYLLDT